MTDGFNSLGAAFASQVRRAGDHLAIKTDSSALSYRDLDVASNRIAHAILASGARDGDPVAVFIRDRAQAVASILAIAKAGRIYMPLDPAHPRSRIEYMLDDAGADLVLSNNEDLSGATELGKSVLNLDALDRGLADGAPPVAVTPEAPAWIVYTSGSTGRPKGVVQSHRNVLRYARNYRHGLEITADDRYVLLFSPVVNAGVHVIFSTLLNGASLYAIDLKRQGIEALPGWLNDNRITLYYSVPTVFRYLMDATTDGGERFDSVRAVMLGGEPMYRRDVEQFRRRFADHCALINRLGSSETGTLCWWFVDPEMPWPGHNVPVGVVAADQEIVLADETGNPVADGEVGEIVVRSAYLSPGYWQHPELTGKAFSNDAGNSGDRSYRTGDMGRVLADGRLVCLGRKDSQIKIRGYRVEPGEVMQALLDLPSVAQAFVLAIRRDTGAQLAAYLVAADSGAVDDAVLRRQLAELLPDYMLPSDYIWLDALPTAPNGKVDRRALPIPGDHDGKRTFTAPRNATEKKIAAIWCEVLQLSRVGVDQNFLDLGGNSLRATRVLARIERDFDVTLPTTAIFDHATIAGLAALISTGRREAAVSAPGKP